MKKKTSNNPIRGLTDDADGENRLTAAQKNAHLELMLGQIANFCPIISQNSIVKNLTSLKDIWQRIRKHFGFQSSGANFMNLSDIRLQLDECPETCFSAS